MVNVVNVDFKLKRQSIMMLKARKLSAEDETKSLKGKRKEKCP